MTVPGMVTVTVGVTGRLTVGLLIGGGVCVGLGGGDIGGGSFVLAGGLVVGAAAGGGVILIGVRGGEVLRGTADGLAVGFFEGTTLGAISSCLGGSAPGEPGCSAMTAPPTVMPVATSATAIRL